MRKFDLPLLLDVLFYSLAAFALSFCVLRYFRLPVPLCTLLSVLFLLATAILVYLLVSRSHSRRNLTAKEREERNALMLHLALEKPERVRLALLTALLADGKDAQCRDDCLCVDGTPLLPLFTMQPISADAVARLVQAYGTNFSLYCNALSPESEKILASFGVQARCANEVYSLFQRTQSTPSPLICGNLPRKTLKTRFLATFRKSNARPFFVSGLLLLVMSLFTLFPVYYLVSGAMLLLLSVGIRLFGVPA